MTQTLDTLIAELRSAFQSGPSPAQWDIISALMGEHIQHPQRAELDTYIQGGVQQWVSVSPANSNNTPWGLWRLTGISREHVAVYDPYGDDDLSYWESFAPEHHFLPDEAIMAGADAFVDFMSCAREAGKVALWEADTLPLWGGAFNLLPSGAYRVDDWCPSPQLYSPVAIEDDREWWPEDEEEDWYDDEEDETLEGKPLSDSASILNLVNRLCHNMLNPHEHDVHIDDAFQAVLEQTASMYAFPESIADIISEGRYPGRLNKAWRPATPLLDFVNSYLSEDAFAALDPLVRSDIHGCYDLASIITWERRQLERTLYFGLFDNGDGDMTPSFVNITYRYEKVLPWVG